MIKINVLHIINALDAGGAQKLVADIVPLMNNIEGVEIEVLILSEIGNVFEEKLIDNNIKINKVERRSVYNPINILLIRKLITKKPYDIVHVHLFPSSYWTSIVSKTLFNPKPKFIYAEHSTHNRRREKWYFRFIDQYIYSSYDKVISISEKTQENLTNWLKVKEKRRKKFVIIDNGIDIKKYSNAKPYSKTYINSNFNADTKILCMVGRFSPQKDQITLIKAIKELPENFHLLLIGEGDLMKKHVTYSKKIKVDDRIHFLGFREDVNRIIKTADVIIMSSHWEGFGLAAVEGMASGKPVIASNVDGLREVVDGAGILFKQGNYSELAREIEKLLGNNKLYNITKQKCIKRAQNYEIEKMVNSYLAEYYAVL